MGARKPPTSCIFWAIASLLSVAMLAGPRPAKSQQPALATPLPLHLVPYVGATWERYVERLRNDFLQLDGDRDGRITQRDVDLHAMMGGVIARAFNLQALMAFDLDGDGAVTEDEVRRGYRYYFRTAKMPQPVEELVGSIMALGTDSDGKVSVVEAGKFMSPLARAAGLNSDADRARQALTFETAFGGAITLPQYEAAGEALFRKVDADTDGKISEQEYESYRKTREP